MTRAATLLVPSLLVVGIVAAGCGDETLLPPAPVDGAGGSGGETSTTSSSSAGGSEPVTPTRQVYERDPFGNVAVTGNLLWDGDFEWYAPFAAQYGWFQYGPGNNSGRTRIETGAICRSGIRCMRLEAGDQGIGLAVVSEDADLVASVWVKPEGGPCAEVGVYLVSQNSSESAAELLAGPQEDDGWCRYSAMVQARQSAQYFFLENASDRNFIVDDAVVVRAEEAQAKLLPPLSLPTGPVDPAFADQVRVTMRKATEPRDDPPSEAEEALKERLRRLRRIRRSR